MCGIAGITNSLLPDEQLPGILDRMRAAMLHRGPDEGRTAVFAGERAGLACQRLSIIDLANGSQPVANEDGAVHVAFNGEIYNHSVLREELAKKGHRFRSRCDTEVIVHLYEEYGIECLERLHGMFALAVFDRRSRELLLARDGAGMKPLYFAQTKHGFIFASEVKALLASGLVRAEPDVEAIDTYLAAGYFRAPQSGFRGIAKLNAGKYLVVEPETMRRGNFWRLRYQDDGAPRNDAEYAEELDSVLRSAVKSHLAADVPVGAYISGGWDSSLVTAMAVEQGAGRMKTFSVVFPDDPWVDESRYSRCLAKHLGTDHHEIEFRAAQIPEQIARTTHYLEEPCSTFPAMLAYQVASAAAKEVKVVLSGEGSDELFGGYPWVRTDIYYTFRKIAPRKPVRFLAERVSHPRWRRVLRIAGAPDELSADAEWRRGFTPYEKTRLLATDYRATGPDVIPLRLDDETFASCRDHLQRRLGLDFTGGLADALLLMNDKMSMAHSIETRMPFLDRGVVDFALRLPSPLKVRKGREKYILSLLTKRFPAEIANRRKQAFAYPLRSLISGASSRFIRDFLLDGDGAGGLLDRAFLESNLDAWLHSGYQNYRRLWTLIFLQSWWNEFFRRDRAQASSRPVETALRAGHAAGR